ncbi:hypothetical protein [Thermocatellispora tengchongensis]|uniref:hypothetical protein n=1 Tax=Thermocatellispora tengchongensis TaxID=1073253 RepID=UPI0036321362
MTWALGTAVRLATQVYADGALVTPATVSLSIRLPDGTIAGPFTGADLISGGVGVYRYDYATVQAGRHVARWITTAPSGVDEEPFDVAPMWGEAGIVSLGAAKRQLKVSPADTSNDDEISTFIRATTEIVQRHAGSVLPSRSPPGCGAGGGTCCWTTGRSCPWPA